MQLVVQLSCASKGTTRRMHLLLVFSMSVLGDELDWSGVVLCDFCLNDAVQIRCLSPLLFKDVQLSHQPLQSAPEMP